MAPVSSSLLVIAAAAFTLGLVHLRMSFQPRDRAMHRSFVAAAFGFGCYALFERSMLLSDTPGQYADTMRWAQLAVFITGLGLLFFVRSYLGGGSALLFWIAAAIRVVSLILNFTTGVNVNFLEIIALRKVPVMGELVAVVDAVPNPAMAIGQVGLLIALVFFATATVSAWRRGERRRALVAGVAVTFFTGAASLFVTLTFWQVIELPVLVSPFFTFVIFGMGYELSRDLQMSAQLHNDLMASRVGLRDTEAQLEVVIGSAMDAVISIDEDQNIILFNSAAEKMFGCTWSRAVGQKLERFIPVRFRGAHAGHIKEFGRTGIAKRNMGEAISLFAIRDDGEEFPIEASIAQVKLHHKTIYTVILRDITQRVESDEALRQSEARFKNVADNAPVMIWMSDQNAMTTYFNQGFLDFTGRPLERELGLGWSGLIHPDDVEKCMSEYNNAFDRREKFGIEVRMRSQDGSYRWIYGVGSPRFAAGGEFLGYVGSCIDVTNQKETTEAVRELGGRLIIAQEEERRRLARELHDDLSQSLALLSIQLDLLAKAPGEPDMLKNRISAFTQEIARLSADVHRISHELHPAKLEQLGLESSLRSFCREIEEARGIKVAFEALNIPGMLPDQVALCLYRVAQESLQNVAKHSGAANATVSIAAENGNILLSVADDGHGFDPDAAAHKASLGLVSVRERIRSVNGTITVDSSIGKGSRVIACIPVSSN